MSLRKYWKFASKIENIQKTNIAPLSDDEMRAYSDTLRERCANGETLEKLLPEAFALVREASKRVLGMEPYPVQLIGGIVLHEGSIAEMRTGEGKTLVAAMPSYLNALTGRGVHIVTVNDYLAKRDAEQIGQIHQFLGLSVGVVLNSSTQEEKKAAYACDITYVTNSEDGFDYLRDNMATTVEGRVQRGLHYAIIDEVDSILIDEARTPLIISGKSDETDALYLKCDQCAKRLVKGEKKETSKWEEDIETGDYVVNEKEKTVILTEKGIRKAEKLLGIGNLADAGNVAYMHGMSMALKANSLMEKNVDYVVMDNQVQIVDQFTGRILPGRRFSDGLHQAIEAKEGVPVQVANVTRATITYQHFFNKYEKKAGMTGTAYTERKEFKDIYKMSTVVIPTNKPVIRKDDEDKVYLTEKEKFHEIVAEIKSAYERRQPVLVGTVDVATSEFLSKLLKREQIPHQVLNAKHHERESEIISHAGEAGTVTISTNMAGRGTDIKLDEEARSRGGLLVIGTARHESRRIDNQLKGRSGRQGDPGRSVFYLSLEDDLMRLYGQQKLIESLKGTVDENEPLEMRMLSKAISKAQQRIEGQHYNTRKSVLEYDTVNDEQRELIYAARNSIIDGAPMRETIVHMARELIQITFENNDDPEMFDTRIALLFGGKVDKEKYPTEEEQYDFLNEYAADAYDRKQAEFGDADAFEQVVRNIALKALDSFWVRHIDDLEHLKESIRMQSYGQKDPRVVYANEAYQSLAEMLTEVRATIVCNVYRMKIQRKIAVMKVGPGQSASVPITIQGAPVKVGGDPTIRPDASKPQPAPATDNA